MEARNNNERSMDRARDIIKKWLTDRGYRAGKLADDAGLNRSILSKFLKTEASKQQGLDTQSALEIYRIMAPTMNMITRRDFLQAAGLSFIFEVSRSLLPFDLQGVQADSLSSEELGRQWMALASDVKRSSWEKALPIYRKAEALFGQTHPGAARAASYVVTILLSLGDYKKAHTEIRRAQQTYAAVIEPEAEASLLVCQGWIYYYEGAFSESIQVLRQGLRLAERIGASLEAGAAYHFLGRAYMDWGESRQENSLLNQAEAYMIKAQPIRAQYGSEDDRAFDFLSLFSTSKLGNRQQQANLQIS